jgi:Arc/MetJ family transcription regulator
MKRTNIVVDEQLLESARRALGERTYSGAITKALERVVRSEKAREAIRTFEELAHTEGVFDPDYILEKKRNSVSANQPKKRLSAHEARVRKPRGSR